MMIPSEIRSLLGDAQFTAYAKLSAGLTSAIGETHLLLVNAQLRVFTRDSIIGEFAQPAVDSSFKPLLKPGTFNDTLELKLADGTQVSLNVSSFDRDGINTLLEQLATTGNTDAATPETSSASPAQVDDSQPELFDEPPEPPPIPQSAEPDEEYLESLFSVSEPVVSTSLTEIEPMPAFELEPEQEPDSVPASETTYFAPSTKKKPAPDDPDDVKANENGIYAYKSSDPGCLGCLLQAILFFGSIYVFWELHPNAMDALWQHLSWGWPDHSGFLWVVTKIITAIAGGYVGVKLCKLVSIYARAKLLGGAAMFKGKHVTVMGPKGRVTQGFDLDKAFSWNCEWEGKEEEESDNADANYNVQVRIVQGPKIALLKGMISGKPPNLQAQNMTYTRVETITQDADAVSFVEKMLRQVVRRIDRMTEN